MMRATSTYDSIPQTEDRGNNIGQYQHYYKRKSDKYISCESWLTVLNKIRHMLEDTEKIGKVSSPYYNKIQILSHNEHLLHICST